MGTPQLTEWIRAPALKPGANSEFGNGTDKLPEAIVVGGK